MKYIIICAAAVAVCIAAGALITHYIFRDRSIGRFARILTAAALSVVLLGCTCLVYLENYYHAPDTVSAYLMSKGDVNIWFRHKFIFFDGPGEDTAIAFYPGAKVDEAAYAPLLFRIAEQGTDCFLLKVPFRVAVLGADYPDRITEQEDYFSTDYDEWYVMGHSLGGSVASMYAADNTSKISGIILLASYPTKAPECPLLSIYGSEDGCLDREAYESRKSLWPEDSKEVVIEGGNHAGFGEYGPQKGDGTATISAEEQQRQTAETVHLWLQGDQ